MEKVHRILKKILEFIQYGFWWIKQWILDNKKTFVLGTVAFALIAGGVFWVFVRTYHNYDIVREIERKSDTSAHYYFSSDGILCYSKDGVSFANNKGDVLWDQVFGMESPKMDACEDYFAIGDIGANSVFVFNKQGMEGRLSLEKPIQDVRVSKQGIVAVVLADGMANQINLYDKNGKILASIKATIATTGYPLTMALSEDGTRLVVSYVLFNGGKVNSQLIFYNFSNKENSGKPAEVYTFEELLPKIRFVDDTTVIACGESAFYSYQFKETVLEQYSQKFGAEAKSVVMTDKHIGIITKNTEESVTDKKTDKYRAQMYRYSGRRAGEFTFDFDYKSVSASDDKILLYNDQECEIYSYHGHKIFQHEFDRNIESLFPGNTSGQYILLDTQSVQTITLK
ncbi:MAG: hypothetical protein II251_08815 [Lachnospiraceae bacterium]|nr:hypothetical protein [Lachnospiraceae bacterium]